MLLLTTCWRIIFAPGALYACMSTIVLQRINSNNLILFVWTAILLMWIYWSFQLKSNELLDCFLLKFFRYALMLYIQIEKFMYWKNFWFILCENQSLSAIECNLTFFPIPTFQCHLAITCLTDWVVAFWIISEVDFSGKLKAISNGKPTYLIESPMCIYKSNLDLTFFFVFHFCLFLFQGCL